MNTLTQFARALRLAAAFTLSSCAIYAEGLSTEERKTIYRELQEPIQIKLKNRQIIPGHSIDVSGDQLQVGTSSGAGEIIYTFNINEIDQFNIPGESYKTLALEWIQSNETDRARELMELLYNQRVQLIPHLSASESHFFIYYVNLILEAKNPARAIAVTELLSPQINNPAAIDAANDAILESYYKLELYEQAAPLAKKWIQERSPYERSSLGYYITGAEHLRNEAYEEALDIALQPIVFSSPVTTNNIGHCYAVAISAALGLRDKAYAATLYNEMLERGLDWPKDDTILAPFHKTILEETTDQ